MNELIGILRRARNLSAILLLQLAASCSVWRPLPGADLSRVGSERLGQAMVTLRDGTELDLDDATIDRDSIIGFGGDSRTRLAVARSEVTGVDTRQTNGLAWFLAGGFTPVVLLAALVVTYVASGGD